LPRLKVPCASLRALRADPLFIDPYPLEGEGLVKKIVLAAIAAVGGALAFKKIKSGKDEQDLWAEATDPVSR
jgi:hypothetical protein